MSTGPILLLSGASGAELAASVARHLGVEPGRCLLERFPDGEVHIEVKESVRGRDVFVVQPTGPPVGENVIELVLLADACRRAGAARITAVVPYLGYARQDRRASGREPVGARVIADVLRAGGLDRLIAVDLHAPALEGVFSIPVEHLSAVPLLADAVRASLAPDALIAAPDLGAVKLAERYARLLQRPMVIVHKSRLSGSAVQVQGLVGDVRGRPVLVIDDMISTGGTIEGAVKALLGAGAVAPAGVVATHGLFVGPAAERLGALPIRPIVTTDSVPAAADRALPVQVVSLAPLLSQAVQRLHEGSSLSELLLHR